MARFKVKMPGFLGDQVTHEAVGTYASLRTGSSATQSTGGRVSPQFIWWPGQCIPNCVCVKDEGCPCCGYGGNPRWPWERPTKKPWNF